MNVSTLVSEQNVGKFHFQKTTKTREARNYLKQIEGRSKSVIYYLINFDTEYDRAKVQPYNGNDPRPPLGV